MPVSNSQARSIFINLATSKQKPKLQWVKKIEHLSDIAVRFRALTHIAFVGTAMLAKAVDKDVDLYAIKPVHSNGNINAYSARTLCHSVLVPLSAEYGVSLGVSGREPLNNQPYFRMNSLGDDTPVRAGAKEVLNFVLDLVAILNNSTSKEAKAALRAFIYVRRQHQRTYTTASGSISVNASTLAAVITDFVQENSEGGKLAQAVVAGIFDVYAGTDFVESGSINDPSRHYPGDVAIRSESGEWEKAIEVRDKPVTASDVFIFGKKCLDLGVLECAVFLGASNQQKLDDAAITQWSANLGLGLTLFYGWQPLIDQALFWAHEPRMEAISLAVGRIEERLISVEASSEAVLRWQQVTRV